MILTKEDWQLRKKVIQMLEEEGVISSRTPQLPFKFLIREKHQKRKIRHLKKYKEFILDNFKLAQSYFPESTLDFEPTKIRPELREIKKNSIEKILHKWWVLVWWSTPYEVSVGRIMSFLVWDKYHNSPIGVVHLTSPGYQIGVRDEYLKIPSDVKEHSYWVNCSMYAQRLGAFPLYNLILGGKLVVLSMVTNEVRAVFERKYGSSPKGYKMLYLTTMSAFGRSSIYNRLKFKDELVAISLGYTSGYGILHVPDDVYYELVKFLRKKGYKVNTPDGLRKFRAIAAALRLLKLQDYTRHQIEREFFLFPMCRNLHDVISKKEPPDWYDRPFDEVVDYWFERYALPRLERRPDEWKQFDIKQYFEETKKLVLSL